MQELKKCSGLALAGMALGLVGLLAPQAGAQTRPSFGRSASNPDAQMSLVLIKHVYAGGIAQLFRGNIGVVTTEQFVIPGGGGSAGGSSRYGSSRSGSFGSSGGFGGGLGGGISSFGGSSGSFGGSSGGFGGSSSSGFSGGFSGGSSLGSGGGNAGGSAGGSIGMPERPSIPERPIIYERSAE